MSLSTKNGALNKRLSNLAMGFRIDDMATRPDVWTVSQLNGYIREIFELDYRLQDIEVSGEISNYTRARSGHLYFTLKDDESQLKCVMWRSSAERLLFDPQDGDAVIVSGRISVYEAGGVYQLYAEQIEAAGRGDLAAAFERLKQRLAGEGLFDVEHKKPIPRYPRKIGVVTSADAAALRDILNVLKRRFPLVAVLIAPTLVQGVEAPAQITRALQWLDGRHDIDTIIIARGGGSLEDLWAFNDESVARAIFAAQHPINCGVGHEIDFTIADFVADLRAPTPSAAAELAVPDMAELATAVQRFRSQLLAEVQTLLQRKSWPVQALAQELSHLSPRANLDSSRQRVDVLNGRLEQALRHHLQQRQARFSVARARLSAVSPLATLARGYAIVRNKDDQVIRTVSQVEVDDSLRIQVSDGEFDARAT